MINGTQLLITWLSPLGEVRDHRPNGAPTPFWVVRRVGGGETNITDHGLYSVHCWAEDSGPANDAHNALMRLANHVYVPVGGQYVDSITCTERLHEVERLGGIRHYTGTYRVDVRIGAITDDD